MPHIRVEVTPDGIVIQNIDDVSTGQSTAVPLLPGEALELGRALRDAARVAALRHRAQPIIAREKR